MQTQIYSLKQYTDFDSAYWGMGESSNGKIYFGLCSHKPGKSAGFFSFDPTSAGVEYLFNLGDVLGSPHGKIHTPIIEGADRRLYFGTHFAYPFGDPSVEVAHEGGHVVSFDPENKQTIDYGVAKKHEGIITITIDTQREKVYALTIPSGYLMQLNPKTRSYKELGKIPSNGSICRTITIDDKGCVYGSFEDNGLFIYDPEGESLVLKPGFFPSEQVDEWTAASRGGVNKIGRKLWRCVNYDEKQNALYGIYSASSRCFRIDCNTLTLDMYESMVPITYNKPANVYPTLSMTANDSRVFYAPADGMFDYCRSDNIHEMTHLMSYDKTSRRSIDLGELYDGQHHVYGVAGATLAGQSIYLLGAVESDSKFARQDQEDLLFGIDGQPFELGIIRVIMTEKG